MRWFKYIAIAFGIVLVYGTLKSGKYLGDPATSTVGDYGPAVVSIALGAIGMRLLVHG